MLHKLRSFAESAIINTESFSFCVVAAEINKRYNMETEQMEDYETVFFDVWYDSPDDMSQMRLHCENLEEATRLLNEVKELAQKDLYRLKHKKAVKDLRLDIFLSIKMIYNTLKLMKTILLGFTTHMVNLKLRILTQR